MSVVGLGTDIVEIARLGDKPARLQKLAERILTPTELLEFQQHAQPNRLLAKRFAAKEAAVKALGTGIGNGISWQHMEITHDELGAPLLTLTGAAQTRLHALGANQCRISIADEQHYATATVILCSNAV